MDLDCQWDGVWGSYWRRILSNDSYCGLNMALQVLRTSRRRHHLQIVTSCHQSYKEIKTCCCCRRRLQLHVQGRVPWRQQLPGGPSTTIVTSCDSHSLWAAAAASSSHCQCPQTQVRWLDVQLDQMQRQWQDLMKAAFYAMKKKHPEVGGGKCHVTRTAFLESELRGYETHAEYVPDPHQVGQLQHVCSCRSHLIVSVAGRTAVYSLDSCDWAMLDMSSRAQEFSCDPL